jgi:hypothetical protein
MKLMRKTLIVTLIVLNIFLALTAILGGLAILLGINVPSTAELEQSFFKWATIPGIALTVIVGGSAAFASVLLIRKSRFGPVIAAAAGMIIMFFEFVEVMIIGSPAGVAETLQIVYYGVGTFITGLALAVWFLDLLSEHAK